LAQGAAYADLDGDGAIDLVTNNMNEAAGIYRNNTRAQYPQNHYLTIQLKGKAPNTFGIGARVVVFAGGVLYYQELQPERGFMSSSEPLLHYGLGGAAAADSIIIIWPDNTFERLGRTEIDKKLVLSYDRQKADTILDFSGFMRNLLHAHPVSGLTDITAGSGIHYSHAEDNSYIDFTRQWFIPHEVSTQGPKVAVGDVNGDGLEDFFVGGGKGQGGRLFIQRPDASFVPSGDSAVFLKDRNCEDVDAIFFDANGDHYPDLYVASGGNEYMGHAEELKDRLYINDGKGHFTLSTGLPALYENKSVVRVADFDRDGDLDIFVGGRVDAGIYGKPPTSYLLQNDGKGNFTVVTNSVIPGLEHLGMITDAAWVDVDKDGWPDLIVTGEWMPPILFRNHGGHFVREALTDDDVDLSGWWCSMLSTDLNGDGYPDLLLGNYGLNSKLTASAEYPLKMYVGDMMNNQRMAQILAVQKEGHYYPFLDKENLEKQLPFLKKKYLSYGKMAGLTVEEIFGKKLDSSALYEAYTLASVALINDGKGHFKRMELPYSMQWSPIFAFALADLNGDGKPDLLAGGNFFGTEPFEGRYDAMPLSLYMGNGAGGFKAVFPLPAPLDTLTGEVRSIQPIRLANGGRAMIVGFNNGPLRLLRY
jgi:enediyne biosynthesis protein E4